MFKYAWDMRLTEAHSAKETILRQLADLELQLEGLLDRIVDAASPAVISAYVGRTTKLERDRIFF